MPPPDRTPPSPRPLRNLVTLLRRLRQRSKQAALLAGDRAETAPPTARPEAARTAKGGRG